LDTPDFTAEDTEDAERNWGSMAVDLFETDYRRTRRSLR
jgi:hypothetical protein